MKFKIFLLGTVAAVSVAAASQSEARNQGWYVGLEAGANWVGDTDFAYDTNPFPPPSLVGSIDFDTGWAALGTVGYAFDNNWRIELEGGYRQNDTDPFFIGKRIALNGELAEYSAMLNVLYDVPLSERLAFTVGLGAGADFSQFDDGRFVDEDDTTFAYQAIAGLSYAVSDRLDVTLTYRYFNAQDPEYSSAVPFETYAFDDLEKQTVTVGLRYDLYEDEAAPPPVAPPPPPVPEAEPKQFIIYFGFNKCNITKEADRVLDEAASAAKSDGGAKVQIVGHTDTVGSDSYNQKLSNCRANAAKSGLVGKGVPADAITASGRGETELMVKTGDNVKEPQNRRATIDLD